ncbi:MAG TPA: GDSL-type esterase/lipase family protein [Armatimonadota bacterium]|jgi:lysophospholipase L1-like esterase
MRAFLLLFAPAIVLAMCPALAAPTIPDAAALSALFAKLERGEAVTVVGIGGSITMAEPGWFNLTTERLRAAYPRATIFGVNAGVSGTGSDLAVYRLQRDVISQSPDLVFIEFVVNDGGAPAETVTRNLESLVVRLKRLPSPPAIVFVNVASDSHAPVTRHQRVADHYGLLSVNLQPVIDARLREMHQPWSALFSDGVHPNLPGHTLYAETIMAALHAVRAQLQVRSSVPAYRLPTPLSSKPLILDGALVPVSKAAPGWVHRPLTLSQGWYGKFFQGELISTGAGATLQLPFWGRAVGIWFLMSEKNGKLQASVDGKSYTDINTNNKWFYAPAMLATDLTPDWHVLSLAVMPGDDGKTLPVELGYLLVQEQGTHALPHAGWWARTSTQGPWTLARLQKNPWQAIPCSAWQMVGPFGGEAAEPWLAAATDLNRDFGVHPGDAPTASYSGAKGRTVSWQPGMGVNGWVDLEKMTGLRDRGVCFARATIYSPKAQTVTARFAVDYFCRLYLNGTRALELLAIHGGPRSGVDCPLALRAGKNDLWLVVHAGSGGYGFQLEVDANAGVTVTP